MTNCKDHLEKENRLLKKHMKTLKSSCASLARHLERLHQEAPGGQDWDVSMALKRYHNLLRQLEEAEGKRL